VGSPDFIGAGAMRILAERLSGRYFWSALAAIEIPDRLDAKAGRA
jgi:hypothetical protein